MSGTSTSPEPDGGLLRLDGDAQQVSAFLRDLQLEDVLQSAEGDHESLYAAVVKLCVRDERHRRYAADLALGLLQLPGPEKAHAVGLRILRLLSEDGMPHARFNLAMERFAGRKLAADPVAGNRLLQSVVDDGCDDTALVAAAWCALGDSHALGRGVPADPQQALDAYEQAARLGSADGAYNAGLLHHARFAPGGQERFVHLDRAASYYEVAIAHGSRPALYNLAIIRLLAGFPGRDDSQGLDLLQRSLDAGDERARQALELLQAA